MSYKILRTEGLSYNDFLMYPDIEIEENAVVFVTGASGSGKSTFFKLLNYTLTPQNGKVYFRNEDTAFIDKIYLRHKIILAGQSPFLFDASIQENFIYFHKLSKEKLSKEKMLSEQDMKAYLALCSASFSLKALCSTLSGGEKQRVFLAIALSLSPELFLLDEPTSALDQALSFQVIENIIHYCKEHNISLMLISHQEALEKKFSQYTLHLTRNK